MCFFIAGAMVGLRYYGGGNTPTSEAHPEGQQGRDAPGSNNMADAFGLRLHFFPEAVGDQIGRLL